MASIARAIPHRFGRLSAQSRLSSSAGSQLRRPNQWVCRTCTYKAVAQVTGRRAFSHSHVLSASEEVNSPVLSASEDVKSTLRLADAIALYPKLDSFPRRHIGPDEAETAQMLKSLSPPADDLDAFVSQVIPADILSTRKLESQSISYGLTYSESDLVRSAQTYHENIDDLKCMIGAGYYGTHTPSVIQRNVLENPAWYTSYTPYQPEISQGRLESLVNFQTMVSDLTALPIANASLLDEGTAAAEAMTLSMNALPSSRVKREGKTFVVSSGLHSQTISVMRGRADGFGIRLLELDLSSEGSRAEIQALGDDLVGVMAQYPDTLGNVDNYEPLVDIVHQQGALFSVATDLLALTILKPPGEWGADIAFGSAQRFGVPMGFGGPHAAFFAVTEKQKRKIPGRLVGLSKDRLGGKAYRLALQTREQHIRREKATSNVCTSQALLANMNALYAIYHGPEGLKAIAERAVRGARVVQAIAEAYGFKTEKSKWSPDGRVMFDTVIIDVESPLVRSRILKTLLDRRYLIRLIDDKHIGISVDETTTLRDLGVIAKTFLEVRKTFLEIYKGAPTDISREAHKMVTNILAQQGGPLEIPDAFRRTSSFLTHPVFNTHHSETELLRYIHHLQAKDLSLVHSMIPLGSCTMKLNGTTEMSLITMPRFSNLHPFTPGFLVGSITTLLGKLMVQLAHITGMDSVSIQPNSGAQGEFAGLRTIRDYHRSKTPDGKDRDICLIPVSAHGTNPASAAMAGMRVVPIKCDTATGNLDLADLEAKCKQYQDQLGAIMVTYPSTYGVFEPDIKKVCQIVHDHGGQVYMDGANMNAQIGLCSPGDIGADVCHLNLHKTFCIPHGGGGPGVGPICVKKHLKPFLPSNPLAPVKQAGDRVNQATDQVNQATKQINKATDEVNKATDHIKQATDQVEQITDQLKHAVYQVQLATNQLKKTIDQVSLTTKHSFAVSSARYGSASISLISWAYNTMMGADGLTHATKITLLNANYILSRLKPHYSILYMNEHGRCAHEFILDVRSFSKSAGVEAIDIAKRLQDYGFHAPTMSWPVANTLMIEPTESESKEELDRFIDALINIRAEIREIEEGKVPREGNVLKNAPHPISDIIMGDGEGKWERSYSREKAAYPLPWLKEKKFWPSVARVDDTYGDLNLFCTCPPVEDTTGDA